VGEILILEQGSSGSVNLLSSDAHALALPVIEAFLSGDDPQMWLL